MHELSVCQALLDQVRRHWSGRPDERVREIVVRIGPLAGVEAELLRQAFVIARAGTIAEAAVLTIESAELRVRCRSCGAESSARPNRMLCAKCGAWQVSVVGGDELLLARIDFHAGADQVLGQEEHAHV